MTVPKIVISVAPENLDTILDEEFQRETKVMIRLYRAAPEMFDLLETVHRQFQPHAVGWEVSLCKVVEALLNRLRERP